MDIKAVAGKSCYNDMERRVGSNFFDFFSSSKWVIDTSVFVESVRISIQERSAEMEWTTLVDW